MIKTVNLQKVFTTEEVETTALNGISLEIQDGEFVAIMGPSGCGKSTLLNILGLLDNPSLGEYHFYGTEVAKMPERSRAQLRKGNIGFVFQSFNLIDELTVYENVELPLLYLKVPAADRKKRAEAALERMNMMHRRNHFPQQLSGGQQQRVAIARALIKGATILLADEPVASLDPESARKVMETIVNLSQKLNLTFMTSLHQIPVARKYCERTIALNKGVVVFDGPTKELTAAILAELYGSNLEDLVIDEDFSALKEAAISEPKLTLVH
jgi:putative ABC transport system ATP-binding protein